MSQNALIGANSQGGGRRVGDDVLIGGMPFVKTGDCSDPEIRDNHAKALVTALELGSKASTLLIGLEKSMDIHQTKVCMKLGEIQANMKEIYDKFIANDQSFVSIRHEVSCMKKDIDGLGVKVRDHTVGHPSSSTVKEHGEELKKHLDWHDREDEKEEDRKFQLLNSVRLPVLRWLLVGVISLTMLGGVITAVATIVKVLPVLDVIHQFEVQEKHKDG